MGAEAVGLELDEDRALALADVARIEEEVAKEVADAVAFAEAGQWEPAADILKDVGGERRS